MTVECDDNPDMPRDDNNKQPERPHLALEAEVAYFNANRERWIAEGEDMRWLAMKGQTVFGFYDSMTDAYAAGVSKVGSEPFLVKQVRREDPVVIIKRSDLRKRA